MQGNSRELMMKIGLFVQVNGATEVKDDLGKLHLVSPLILDSFQRKWTALDEQDIPKLLASAPEVYSSDTDDDLFLAILAERWLGDRL